MNDEREERLAAWLDGELSPEEAEAFAAEVERDPELARLAATWRGNDAFIAGAFAPIAEEAIPADMLDRLGLGAQPSAAPPAAANDNQPWWRRHALPLGGAIAASLVAALILAPRLTQPTADAVSLALDSTPSGQVARLADGRELTPSLTVRDAKGRWCREYAIGESVVLACREDGRWKTEGEAMGDGPQAGGDIAMAGGGNPAGLRDAYQRIGASDPLGASEERALIERQWRR